MAYMAPLKVEDQALAVQNSVNTAPRQTQLQEAQGHLHTRTTGQSTRQPSHHRGDPCSSVWQKRHTYRTRTALDATKPG
jgi:hypothetical protein